MKFVRLLIIGASLTLAATLAAISLAQAQTYKDSGGTPVPGSVPLVGCSSSGNCSGPASSSNPMPVTMTGGSHLCSLHTFAHITTATDTQLVAASGSKTIYVCDYSFSFGGSGNAYLEKSTTGTCGSPTQIAGTWYGVANLGKAATGQFYEGLNTGASAQLCVNTSAAVSFDIDVYYDQY